MAKGKKGINENSLLFSILSFLLLSLLLKSLNQSDNLSFPGRKLVPLNSAAPIALCFDVGFNFCL